MYGVRSRICTCVHDVSAALSHRTEANHIHDAPSPLKLTDSHTLSRHQYKFQDNRNHHALNIPAIMNSNPSLILSNDNLRNTTFDCDAFGIHYQVSTEKHLLVNGKNTQVRRWDQRSNQNILIAEWERHNFHTDVFKFPNANGGASVPVSTFMNRKWGFTKK